MRNAGIFRLILLAAAALAPLAVFGATGDDWVLYAASGEREDSGSTLQNWYLLNRYQPVPEGEAATLHYFDRDSIAASSPLPGSITRVWERSVVRRETQGYLETRRAIEREEAGRLKREINVLDQAWIFPLAVKRAAKETQTLYEINCGTREFIILEVNQYDRDGERMTRESNMDRETWHAIEPGSVMEALFRQICK